MFLASGWYQFLVQSWFGLDPGLLSSWNPPSDNNGTSCLSQRPSGWSARFQMFTDVGDAAQWETWTLCSHETLNERIFILK